MMSSCARHDYGPMNGPHDDSGNIAGRLARSRCIRGDRGRASGQGLQDHPRRGRCVVSHRARQHHRAARRQRRRQDHDHCDDHGTGAADLGARAGAGPFDARAKRRGAGPDEFRKPLCRHADAAHGAAKSHRVRPALCGQEFARAHRGARRRSRLERIPRSSQWKTVLRAEDAGGAGQGADQPARTAAARRADGVARSRHRRLDQAASDRLSQGQQRDHSAGVAQHAGGRAAVRPRHHHEARPHRG